MNLKETLPIIIGSLIMGFGGGWICQKQAPPKVDLTTSGHGTASQKTAPIQSSSLPQTSAKDLDNFLTNYLSEDSGSDKPSLIANISHDEIPDFINHILQKSGPDGLDYEYERAIYDFLAIMMEADPMNTVQWILSQEHILNRDFLFEGIFEDYKTREANTQWVFDNFDELMTMAKQIPADQKPLKILSKIIGTNADHDLLETIQLSKEHLIDDEGEINFPSGVQEKAIAKGWDYAFEYYKDSWKEDNNGYVTSWGGDFPQDFDFQSFATAWAEHGEQVGTNEKQQYYNPPLKIWKEWARADPQAANEFRTTHSVPSFGMDDFLGGYAQSAEPRDLYEYLGGAYSQHSDDQGDIDRFTKNYLEKSNYQLNEFVNWTNETGQRELYDALITRNAYSQNKLHTELIESIPQEERIPYLFEVYSAKPYKLRADTKETYQKELSRLGHSQQEIDLLLNVSESK